MRPTGPLFKWFGSKWLSSKTLPPPKYDTIIEPFAGGAGYSLRYADRKVVLAEANPQLFKLWRWLIVSASEDDIRQIPIGLTVGSDIRDLEMSEGQSLLLKMWQRTNNVGNCWIVSPWGNKPGQWTANTRARVAEEVMCIRHWRMLYTHWEPPMRRERTKPVTFFVDPPYQYNYNYRCPTINHMLLGSLCASAYGQVIVCEARDPKTGIMPSWLPFRDWGLRVTSRRKATENHHSRELIWVSE